MSEPTGLPIVEELGAEFRALVAAELQGHERRTRLRSAPPARRRQRGGGTRIARRSSILLVLLCLVGGVALASRFGTGDSPPADTEPARLATEDGWQLSAYRDEGRLCLLFAAGGQIGSDCGARPAARGVRATSVLAPRRRFVVGLAGSRVDAVEVTVAGNAERVATHGPTEAARSAGMPADTRWFALAYDTAGNPEMGSAPARVVPLGPSGSRLGPGELDCSLGVSGGACRRAIERRATDALR